MNTCSEVGQACISAAKGDTTKSSELLQPYLLAAGKLLLGISVIVMFVYTVKYTETAAGIKFISGPAQVLFDLVFQATKTHAQHQAVQGGAIQLVRALS